YHVDGAVCIVHAGFPHPDSCFLTVNQSIAPNPETATAGGKVVANTTDFSGKQFSLVTSTASWALIVTYIKDFVHAGMKPVGLKRIAYFVNQIKYNAVHIRVKWTVTLAVQSVGVRPTVLLRHFDMGSFVELGVYT